MRRRAKCALVVLVAVCAVSGAYICLQLPPREAPGEESQVWAVGGGGLVMRLDGGQWGVVAFPSDDNLRAVWVLSPDSVWVAGGGGQHGWAGAMSSGGVWEFDGSAWRETPMRLSYDNYSYEVLGYYSVCMLSPDRGWLTIHGRRNYTNGQGKYGGGAWDDGGVVFAWDGSEWVEEYYVVDAPFESIRMLPDGAGWVAGYCTTSPYRVWRRDAAGAWSAVLAAESDYYLGVWPLSYDEAWLAGQDMGGNIGVISHLDGGELETDNVPGAYMMTGIQALPSGEAFAVGGSKGPTSEGAALRYDGSAWGRVPLPGGTPVLWSIYMRSASEGWAVGGYTGGVLLKWDGGAWLRVADAPATILSVHGA